MPNSFTHLELGTDDPGRARAFYETLFGWKMEETPMGGGPPYLMFRPASGPSGGVFQKPDAQTPTMWTPYVRVASIDATLAKAADLGATVVVPKSPIPGMGHFAIFSDPTGAMLGLFEGH